jgi:hypothetical protein
MTGDFYLVWHPFQVEAWQEMLVLLLGLCVTSPAHICLLPGATMSQPIRELRLHMPFKEEKWGRAVGPCIDGP